MKPEPTIKKEAPSDFRTWWEPYDVELPSGAHVGGHQNARRVWSQYRNGRWIRRTYGIHAYVAWLCQIYRSEFEEWKAAGYPERAEQFVSVCATPERVTQFWRELKPKLEQIGQKVAA
jgi:hypothetical protein